MKNIKSAALVLTILTAGPLSAGDALGKEYVVDSAHSSVNFVVRHMISKTRGQFNDFEGAFSFDSKKLDASKVSFMAKAASIDTNNQKRDEHLRSGDFFDVEKYPTLSFASRKLTPKGKNTYKLDGDLTIHGVTKPVSFEVEYSGEDKDPWGNVKAGFSAATKVNRKDFGLTWNKALDSGGIVVGEEVEIRLEVEGNEKKTEEKK